MNLFIKVKETGILRKVSIVMAHLVCYINVVLIGTYIGFVEGYVTKVRELEPNAMICDPFSSVYDILGVYHIGLLLPLIIVVIASSIKERLLTHVLQILYWPARFGSTTGVCILLRCTTLITSVPDFRHGIQILRGKH